MTNKKIRRYKSGCGIEFNRISKFEQKKSMMNENRKEYQEEEEEKKEKEEGEWIRMKEKLNN